MLTRASHAGPAERRPRRASRAWQAADDGSRVAAGVDRAWACPQGEGLVRAQRAGRAVVGPRSPRLLLRVRTARGRRAGLLAARDQRPGARAGRADGEERPLRQWDLLHCPAGTKHTIVGAYDAPCVVLAVGARDRSPAPTGVPTPWTRRRYVTARVWSTRRPTGSRRTRASGKANRRTTATAGCPSSNNLERVTDRLGHTG